VLEKRGDYVQQELNVPTYKQKTERQREMDKSILEVLKKKLNQHGGGKRTGKEKR